VTPLGSNTAYSVNFALICATHQDLAAQVAAGAFREDLLYRIQEFHLRIPPLREWPDTRQFIQKLWQELGAGSRDITLSEEALHALAARPWPGNVRQLLSQLRVLLALADDHSVIRLADLPGEPTPASAPVMLSAPADEQIAIREAQGNMSLAAKNWGFHAVRFTDDWKNARASAEPELRLQESFLAQNRDWLLPACRVIREDESVSPDVN
jgi:transcriptional regulator of acetoin/glycerol metabolism